MATNYALQCKFKAFRGYSEGLLAAGSPGNSNEIEINDCFILIGFCLSRLDVSSVR
jgi:hypothetical protein